jgi:hypothetical protein
VFTGITYHADPDDGGVPRFGYAKADRRVTAYYFYWSFYWSIRRSGVLSLWHRHRRPPGGPHEHSR